MAGCAWNSGLMMIEGNDRVFVSLMARAADSLPVQPQHSVPDLSMSVLPNPGSMSVCGSGFPYPLHSCLCPPAR